MNDSAAIHEEISRLLNEQRSLLQERLVPEIAMLFAAKNERIRSLFKELSVAQREDRSPPTPAKTRDSAAKRQDRERARRSA